MEKTKSRLDFHRAETELFIGYYLGQECLWNLQHANYSKRENRTAAQAMIAKQMICQGREMTVEQVASKIASLRTYYGRELRKINASEKSGAGTDQVYHSTWEFFPLLDPFLRCHVQQRTSSTNMLKEEVVSACEGLSGCAEPSEGTDGPTAEEPSHHDSNNVAVPALPVSSTKKRKVSESTGNIENLIVKSLLTMEEKNRTKTERLNDTDYLFGHQVGLEIKIVQNPRKKQELKLKIQQLMFDYIFENEQ